MSGKKHVFKMIPGKEVFRKTPTTRIKWPEGNDPTMPIKKVELVSLDDKNDVVLGLLPIKLCSSSCLDSYICLEEENEGNLVAKDYKSDSNLDYVKSNHTFVYYGNELAKLSYTRELVQPFKTMCSSSIKSKKLEYKYVTWEDSDTGNNKYYFSDEAGNIIDSPDNEVLQDIMLYYGERHIRDVLLLLSNAFTKVFIQGLTDGQLKTLANTLSNEQLQKIIPELSSSQLQALAENLTDEQLQALVDHLTNHQLKTLAQELNPEKLQIIVPILNDTQLEALVRKLNSEQVKEILPHLKVDQFKALIKTLNDEQFTVLAKDLAEHHLTILSKELEGDQLKALVNSLQEEQLKDLVNKLDPEKLEAIAQDLTDSNKIQIIIKSLVDNPDKLQAFARNMSNEQFKELLDNVGAEELKDIIHKLPYEKVTAVIGDLSNQDQSKAIIDALKGKLDEQSKQNKEMIEMLKQIKDDMPGIAEAPDFTIVENNNDSMLLVW
ncbi:MULTISPECIES: magnesium transporter MgtE N-terminal domain-containing protein [Wolbachia]|uniref:magnesium transporter MgtE N-terminal domain-containing protein n=1 Tax=Wolbachia TaxID=953 RepID=UPI000571A7E3|nr:MULTISPECIES: MgtE intracellular N domain protein [Wolbachia]AOV87680.1 MgtE intracellular N domain protein [Wolbachia endosymbiont of Drosophila incompta]AOV88333.1 MgtE intracellular N domain protein [Wolbachia endosymbiont of Drosophila incompta]MBA8753231.1 MgtE intracellular N domain protein [Wolbachia pipientis]MDE5064919.1 MgtE intracellular N domain protein [Wolbachia endosymbiont of Drosophila tristis]MDU8920500.1 MgtE intracellular N domain protein [Wolbachia endosymbiont of Droso